MKPMAKTFHQECDNAIESFGKENRSFDCRRCGERFQPARGQFIFYDLCDSCFEPFDDQKMHGRYTAMLQGRDTGYTEDVAQWITWQKPN